MSFLTLENNTKELEYIQFVRLVLSWNIGSEAMWRVAWLLQYIFIGLISQNSNSWRNCFTHISSQVRDAIALYSASIEDQTTTFCFMLFQEIIFPPRKTQYPVVGRLSIGEPNPKILVFTLSSQSSPCPGAFLRYLRIRLTNIFFGIS